MGYKVISRFRDKDDKVYEVGDKYNGTKARVAVLSTTKNAYNRVFIEEDVEEQKKEPKKAKKRSG